MNTPPVPDADAALSMLTAAIGQIDFARRYTLQLLDATPRERWFEMPIGLPTNIAWQVGHMTVSQYGLLLFRIRGRKPEDLDLIPGKFRKAYGRESVPSADPANQPSPDELLDRMSKVYQIAGEELSHVDAATLLEPVDMPYAAYPNKLGAVLFCLLHEHIHCGHLAMLRRAMGLDPIR